MACKIEKVSAENGKDSLLYKSLTAKYPESIALTKYIDIMSEAEGNAKIYGKDKNGEPVAQVDGPKFKLAEFNSYQEQIDSMELMSSMLVSEFANTLSIKDPSKLAGFDLAKLDGDLVALSAAVANVRNNLKRMMFKAPRDVQEIYKTIILNMPQYLEPRGPLTRKLAERGVLIRVRDESVTDLLEQGLEAENGTVDSDVVRVSYERIYDMETLESSAMRSISEEVKTYIRGKEKVNDKGESELSLLGTPRPIEAGEAISDMFTVLAGVQNPSEMLERLEQAVGLKPHLMPIYSDLMNEQPKQIKVNNKTIEYKPITAQLFSTFAKQDYNMHSVVEKIGGGVMITAANAYNTRNNLKNRWKQQTSDIAQTDQTRNINKLNSYTNRADLNRKLRQGNSLALKSTAAYMRAAGFHNVTPAILKDIVDTFNTKSQPPAFKNQSAGAVLVNMLNLVAKPALQGKDIFKNVGETMAETKYLNLLAEHSTKYETDVTAGAFKNSAGKTTHPLNKGSEAQDIWLRLNRDTKYANQFLNDPMYENTKILNTLFSNPEGLNVTSFSTLSNESVTNSGVAFGQLSNYDAINLKLNSYFQGKDSFHAYGPTQADRGNISALVLPKISQDEKIFDQSGTVISPDIKEWVFNQVKGELQRVLNTKDSGYKNHNKNSQMFNLFEGLNEIFKAEDVNMSNIDQLATRLAVTAEQHLYAAIQSDIAYMAKKGVIELDVSGGVRSYKLTNDAIVSDNAHSKGKITNKALNEFLVNNFIYTYEQTLFYAGDPAFFKGKVDMNKRMGLAFTPGEKVTVGDATGIGPTAKIKILQEAEMKSEMAEVYKELLGEKAGKAFLQTEVADGAGFVSLDRYGDLALSRGKHSIAMLEYIDEMSRWDPKKPMPSTEAVLEVYKGFYFRLHADETGVRPFNLKYSTLPVFPAFFEQTKADGSLKYPGMAKISQELRSGRADEVVMGSAVKVGGSNFATLETLAGTEATVIYNESYRFPQDSPTKDKTEDNFGSQMRKLITSNQTPAGKLSVFGETVSEGASIGSYNDAITKIVGNAATRLNKRFLNGDSAPKVAEPMTMEKAKATLEKVQKNTKFIKLEDDGSGYVNTKTGKRYQRVTEFISTKETKMNDVLKSAVNIGNKLDVLTRDFFDGNLKSAKEYDVADSHIVKGYVNQLKEVKAFMDKRGEVVMANDIVLYNDEIGVAGTVDLITYDKDGEVRIYDMKTMRGNQLTESYAADPTVSKYDTTVYGDSNREKHRKQLSMYRILLNNTHGIKAKETAIIPIEVMYKQGETRTSRMNLLDGIPVKPLSKVGEAELINLDPNKGYHKGELNTAELVSSILDSAEASGFVNLDYFLEALTVKDGELTLPLNYPTIKFKTDSLINSAYKKGAGRIKLAGHSAVQVSSLGMVANKGEFSTDSDLKFVRFSKKGSNKELSQLDSMEVSRRIRAGEDVSGEFKTLPAQVRVSPKFFKNKLKEIAKGRVNKAAIGEALTGYRNHLKESGLSEAQKQNKVKAYESFLNKKEAKKAYDKLAKTLKDDKGNWDASKLGEVADIVLYRIPTQAKNSMLSGTIIGFLPEESGATIQVPSEIVDQAGSDFDIDKVYIETTDFNVSEGQIKRVMPDFNEYGELGENSDRQLKAYIQEYHKAVLSSTNHVSELMTPNDTIVLSKLVEEFNMGDDVFNGNWASLALQETFRSNNKAGKEMISISSVASVAHAIAEQLGVESVGDIKIAGKTLELGSILNSDGTRISDEIGEIQNAALDNARDPLLGKLNIDAFTASVVMLLVSAGHGLKYAATVVNDPIIRDLASEYQKHTRHSSPRIAYETAVANVKKRYAIRGKLPKVKLADYSLENAENNRVDQSVEARKEALVVFDELKKIGDKLSKFQTSLNFDSKGTPSTSHGLVSKAVDIASVPGTYLNTMTLNGVGPLAEIGLTQEIKDADSLFKVDPDLYETSQIGAFEKGVIIDPLIVNRKISVAASVVGADIVKLARSLNIFDENGLTHVFNEFDTFLLQNPVAFKDSSTDIANMTSSELASLTDPSSALSPSNLLRSYRGNLKEGELENKFTKGLDIVAEGGHEYITINNNLSVGMTPEGQQEVMVFFEDLMASDNTAEATLAKQLTKYALAVSGYSKSFSSFMHLLPPSAHVAYTNSVETFRNMGDQYDNASAFHTGKFLDMYVQNNADRLKIPVKKDLTSFGEFEKAPTYVFKYISKDNKQLHKWSKENLSYDRIGQRGLKGLVKEYHDGESMYHSDGSMAQFNAEGAKLKATSQQKGNIQLLQAELMVISEVISSLMAEDITNADQAAKAVTKVQRKLIELSGKEDTQTFRDFIGKQVPTIKKFVDKRINRGQDITFQETWKRKMDGQMVETLPYEPFFRKLIQKIKEC